MNALKHGIFSKEVLVHGLYFDESSEEFTALHDRFCHAFSPVGLAEEMLVDQIVTAHWRLRRAMRAESGEIALCVDGAAWQRSRHHPHWSWTELGGQFRWVGDPVPQMEDSAEGNSMMELWLNEIRAHVENEGELTEAALKIPFFGRPNSISRELEELRLQLCQNSGGDDAAMRRDENKAQALMAIDRKLERLESRRADCAEREASEEVARQSAAVLPGPQVLDKILRYEAKHERQMYRAMNQLERLQRRRLGEAVPPPLTMEMSECP